LRVSVVVPVLNDPRVERAIRSILQQDVDPSPELVVVDGGSSATTREILQRYEEDIAVLISEADHGIFDAFNKGIRATGGDIIALLGSDDVYANEKVLQDVVREITTSGSDGCYGDLAYVDGEGRVRRYWRAGVLVHSRIRFGWMIPHMSLFLRRDVYNRMGLFDTTYRIGADYEFMLRVLLSGTVSLSYLQHTLVHMELGGVSNRSVKNILRANREVYRALVAHDFSAASAAIAAFAKPVGKLRQFVHRPR